MSVLSMSEVPFEQDRTAVAKPGEPGAAASTALTRNQWRFIVLLMLSVNINFLDRGSLAAAAPAIASELFLSPMKLGVLLSAFSWSYPPFLLIAGWAVDRYSVKWVFAAGFLLWSLATLASGLTHSFNMLLALRFVEAVSAGEDQICAREELPLEVLELGRCAVKVRELVHAVVDRQRRVDVT